MSVDVAWYMTRLRLMSPAEIVYRVRERFHLRALERSQPVLLERRLRPATDAFSFCTARSAVLATLTWDLHGNSACAPQMLDGQWPALGFDWRWASARDTWHRAPDTGKQWPRWYFAKVEHRHGNPHGDARVVWEPARLQQLVGLALLCRRPHYRADAVGLIERQLVSFTRANPPYIGIHYVSAMECALRIIAVCHAIDMVRRWIEHPRATWAAVLVLVESHARLIEKRLSLHSSAANHTIAEAVGLVYAGTLFPELDRAMRWRQLGVTLLKREIPRQILPDGGGAEQAPGYLKQIADLATLARLLHPDLASIELRIALARRFLAETRGDASPLTAFGDDDGGHVLSRFWKSDTQAAASSRLRAVFPHAGYTILRSRAEALHQIGFRHGALGLPPLHGHGHADLLSVTWRAGRRDVLVDPGTFTYTAAPAWRRYFRGTGAHNTVTVDGRDQSNQRGPFIWHPTVSGRLVRATSGNDHSVLLATHDGFPDLDVRHWRGLIYGHGNRLVVWDHIAGHGEHTVSAWWHLGEDAQVEDGVVRAVGREWMIAVAGASEIQRYRGSVDPIVGWRSFRYGSKVPNTCIEARYTGMLPHTFVTVIAMGCDENTAPDQHEASHLATLQAWRDSLPRESC